MYVARIVPKKFLHNQATPSFVMMIEGDAIFLMFPRQESPVEGQLAIISKTL